MSLARKVIEGYKEDYSSLKDDQKRKIKDSMYSLSDGVIGLESYLKPLFKNNIKLVKALSSLLAAEKELNKAMKNYPWD